MQRTGAHVRFGSKADMCNADRHVRFVPIADMGQVWRADRASADY